MKISIHALLAESDVKVVDVGVGRLIFLSTLSLRRATPQATDTLNHWGISIHALLAESDLHPEAGKGQSSDFYPRSPCGERQRLGLLGWLRVLISIHALLAESDRKSYDKY